MDFFRLKMGRLCTAGGFEVIPEQAQQYDPFKVLCFCGTLFLGTVIHDSIM